MTTRTRPIFVWEIGADAIGGFIAVSLRPWAEGCLGQPVPYVEGWYVADACRRQGVGRALMRAAERWAQEVGFTELGSDVRVDNEASLLAHERLGFDPTERLQFFRKDLTAGGDRTAPRDGRGRTRLARLRGSPPR